MQKIKVVLFFSSFKGLYVYKHLLKSKKFLIQKIFLGKKNLNEKILSLLKKKNYKIFDNINSASLKLEVQKLKTDFIIIAGLHYILKKSLIDLPKYCTINLHSGRIPKYKGGSPLNWQIINNEKNFYLSILKVDEGIDTGDLLLEKKFNLRKEYGISDLHKISNKTFPFMTEEVITNIIKGNQNFKKQNTIQLQGNYFRQRKPDDSKINWKAQSNLQVYNLIRASNFPEFASFSFYNKNKIIFFKSKISYKRFTNKKPGQVIIQGNKTYIKCKRGFIEVINFKGKLKSNMVLT